MDIVGGAKGKKMAIDETVKVRDDTGRTIDIPKKEYDLMNKRCGRCDAQLIYLKLFGDRIDYLTCPYDCLNTIHHYRIMHPERARYE